MRDLRLGDVLDDFCIKCRRLTNHSIVSLLAGKAAKVRCRTCYNDHDFRNEQAPPSKKDLKKAALFNQVLASAGVPAAPAASDVSAAPDPPALEAVALDAAAADPAPEAAAAADPKPAGRK